MHITKVHIVEGFLDGLELDFTSGLNVIIGARGTGKTSLIELIRFCLGVSSHTPASANRSKDHALSVLGSGQITIHLSDEDNEIIVTRTAADDEPRSSEPFIAPVIFSQTEIENVGFLPKGRLNLIDGFIPERHILQRKENSVIGQIKSITTEIAKFSSEIVELNTNLAEIKIIDEKLAELLPAEQGLAKLSEDASNKTQQLNKLSQNSSKLGVSLAYLERFQDSLKSWNEDLEEVLSSAPELEKWPHSDLPDPTEEIKKQYKKTEQLLIKSHSDISNATDGINKLKEQITQEKFKLEENIRQLRKQVDALQKGAGEVVRQGQVLREKKAKLIALQNLVKSKSKLKDSLVEKRGECLDELDKLRERRFNKRVKIANEINSQLGPKIQVEIERLGQFDSYASIITEILRGTGLKYNELAPLIAQQISPRELLEASESNNSELVAEVVGITEERASRVLMHLRDADLGDLATALVEDEVSLRLLDGKDYKDLSELSTGQRCTVILPIILRHNERILIVDQPEDHIDNAFIADTLIKSIVSRSSESQIIFSSHNANIPVLGNADFVIQMASDGSRGYVELSANLMDLEVVNAISVVMEGGQEAFDRRAEFYAQGNVFG